MIEQIGNALQFDAWYSSAGLGVAGLTVTVNVYRNSTLIVTGAAATEIGDGFYTYSLASSLNTVEGIYKAIFMTATTTVDQQHLVCAWAVGKAGVENLDALISSTKSIAVSSTVAASVSSGSLGLQTYYSFDQTVVSDVTEDLSTATKLWLAIKDSAVEEDDKSLVFVEKTGGLTVLAKAAHTTTSDGDLAVTGSSGDWDIAISLSASATGQLHGYYKNTKYAELKALVSGETIVVWSGTAEISQGLVQSIT